jgi:hypothetical protein
MRRRFCAIPAVYIEWRSGLFAAAGADEDQAEHLRKCSSSQGVPMSYLSGIGRFRLPTDFFYNSARHQA